MERYIEEALFHVGFSKKKRVKQQIVSKIQGLSNEKGYGDLSTMTEEQVKDVLTEMGDPRLLARSYGWQSSIVGKESAVAYHRILILTAFATLLANALSYWAMNESGQKTITIGSFIKNYAIQYALLVIGITLLIRIANIFRKKEEHLERLNRGEWTIQHLRYPKIKRPNKCENYVVGLFVKIILLVGIYITDQYLCVGAFVRSKGEVEQISLFDGQKVQDYRILLTCMLVLGIAYSVLAIWRNRPDFILLILKSISALFNGIGCIIVLRYPGIWNGEFLNQLKMAANSVSWETLTMQSVANFSIAAVLVIASVDILHAFYRFFANV
ncbi:hypothetical protein [Anaerosporobacter faecicola]|uniref:hypothetical protein n=1 Tax=Anaerosporobacter faecicola TaxID=2718714 RepID=UPI00143BE3C7|nr:hypothetical protein [Anaerosporobacter faecicola]